MKTKTLFYRLTLASLFLIFVLNCKKEVTVTAPTLTTTDVSALTSTTAISGGNVTADGGTAITSRGVCWGITSGPTVNGSKTSDGTGISNFSSSITGLTPGIVYYLRAYAINSKGTAYGNEITFTTKANLPTLSTTAITSVTLTAASSGGNVTADGGGTITVRGVCWGTTPTPTTANSKTTDGTGTGIFTSAITGLSTGMTYYVRAYATNSAGTAYGNPISFMSQSDEIIYNPSLTYGTLTDIEGNIYKTITIGTQTWMAENLKTTKFKDGTAIPLITDNNAWKNLITPGYCWYDNNAISYKGTYGALYNWYSVNTSRLCPTSWHVPTEAEWNILTSYVGGNNFQKYDGGSLKETGTHHWKSPNSGATNLSGFSALPGGDRDGYGTFYYIGAYGYWWSSSEKSAGNAWFLTMTYDLISTGGTDNLKIGGFSVRCLMDFIAVPVLSTFSASNITTNSATSGGNVTNDGGGAVTSRGVCWATSQNPTISNSKTNDGTGSGSFTSSITGLIHGTTYYVRAYATNFAGTSYGNQIIISALAIPPTVNTISATAINSTIATTGGNVTSDGGGAVTSRGVCWGTSQNPTISNSKTTDGTGSGNYASSLTGLNPGATYYVRAYATNIAGTSYGNQITFNTPIVAFILPTVTISAVTNIQQYFARSGGNVMTDGGTPVTDRGVCFGTSQNPAIGGAHTTDGTGTGTFGSDMNNLKQFTIYYVRAYATNSVGTAYSGQLSFRTAY